MKINPRIAGALLVLVVGTGAGLRYDWTPVNVGTPAPVVPASPQPNGVAPQTGGPDSAAGGNDAPTGTAAAPSSVAAKQDGVEIVATFLNAEGPQPDGQLAFGISFDNHAVNFGDLNLAVKASLTAEPGEPVISGFDWKQEGSGHHASGVLTVKNQGAEGKPIVTRQTPSLTLELRNAVGTGSLIFRFNNGGWNVPD